MAVITVNSASFCDLEQILEQVEAQTSFHIMGDDELIRRAAAENQEEIPFIHQIFQDRKKRGGRILQRRHMAMARVKNVLAQTLLADDILIHGLCSMMVPNDIYHVLKVGILADENFRTARVREMTGQSLDKARELISRDDTLLHTWAEILNFGNPWDPSKYDLFIPLHKKTVFQAVQSIIKYCTSDFVCKNNRSMKKAADFLLASQVELALAVEGHEVKVTAYGQDVVLAIPKNIILLHKLEDEILSIASKVAGVKRVSTELSDDFYKQGPSAGREQAQSKLLLVDDEREFVHTLSERLLMREIGSAVVYDGEQALAYVEEENPGVIILDLKMPGIDGVEVLRRVKSAHPDIEIIILSGHGSREDKKKCLELGAAAYLEKPVDIDKLTSLLQKLQEIDQGSE